MNKYIDKVFRNTYYKIQILSSDEYHGTFKVYVLKTYKEYTLYKEGEIFNIANIITSNGEITGGWKLDNNSIKLEKLRRIKII